MPTKIASRARDREHQQRTWGTRFDTLNTSPGQTSSSESDSPPGSPKQLEQQLGTDVLGAEPFGDAPPGRTRDWADDEVPTTLLTPRPPFSDTGANLRDWSAGAVSGATAFDSSRKDASKMPHNASVFVGSLPPDADEGEVGRFLREHLEQFANIINIKIIRDSKGGVCAFIQCEDAKQALRVISEAQLNPRPFMGRYLRFESAKAFRTLWISYCKPMLFIPRPGEQAEEAADSVVDENGVSGRWEEVALPDCMRIWRPRGTRFPIVTYQAEARNFSGISRPIMDHSPIRSPDAFDDRGVLFTELKFDAETLKEIVSAFGPLESFKPYSMTTSPNRIDAQKMSALPIGHDGPRSPNMDMGVWEVKWEHRDNCVTALSTLRRIPHLAVTWANPQQSAYPPTPRQNISHQGLLQSPASPRFPPLPSSKGSQTPIINTRPYLLLDRSSAQDVFNSKTISSPTSPSFKRSPVGLHAPSNILPSSPSLGRGGNEAVRHSAVKGSEGEDSDDGWTVVRQHNNLHNITHTILSSIISPDSGKTNVPESEGLPAASDAEAIFGKELRNPAKSPKWSESDFPPLKFLRGEGCGETADSKPKEHTPVQHSAAPLIEDTESTVNQAICEAADNADVSRPPLLHRRSHSNPIALAPVQIVADTPQSQTLELPPTPELAHSPLSQTPTSAFPHTPLYPAMDLMSASLCRMDNSVIAEKADDSEETSEKEALGPEREIDPKTIFVGGLDPFGPLPWDENRLRTVFQRYGDLQSVRLIISSTKNTAFAFITFNNDEAPINAIRGEHNRNYDGRIIRVQLREIQPGRGGFKYRGRGVGRSRRYGWDLHAGAQSNNTSDYSSPARRTDADPFNSHYAGVAQSTSDRFGATVVLDMQKAQRVFPSTPHDDSVTLFSSASFESNPEADSSLDSDARTAVSNTPSPTVLSSSASGNVNPSTPHSAPSTAIGCFPTHPWTSPYGVPMHFPVPVTPFNGVAQPFQYAPISHLTDTNGAAANPSMQWAHMYRPGFAYAPYPYIPLVSSSGAAQLATSSQPPTPLRCQPPLHATGFIQGEHGTLIPVYHPQALNDYMSGSSGQPHTPGPGSATTPVPSANAQPQAVMSAPLWQGYPPHPHGIYTYHVPPPTSIGTSTTPPAAVQQQAIHQQIHGRPLQPSSSASYVAQSNTPTTAQTPQQPSFTATSAYQHHGISYVSHSSGNPRGSAHGHAHAGVLDRSDGLTNRHPQRQDREGSYYGRNGHDHNGHSPSGRFSNRTVHKPRTDQHQNYAIANSPIHHRQGAVPVQLGHNKHNPDTGPLHHWTIGSQQ